MLRPGLRVVRGPNWCSGNQDGGEGYVGTVRDINLPGTPSQTVVVHWDNGNRLNCRVGYMDKYDLRVIDNAQIGARHRHICDGCENGITGMRYHCISCHDYDLCFTCYNGDKHDLTHQFNRFDDRHSKGVNLPPRFNARKCELKGIFKGAKVVRGYDWEWGNQDGGPGKIGVVLDIRGWEAKTSRSTANIKWFSGNTHMYRIGHKGYCDIQFVESSSGGNYYPEHLPVLGQRDEVMEWNGILDAIDRQQIMQLEKEASKIEDQRCKNKKQQDPTLSCLGHLESMYASVIMDYNKSVNASLSQTNNRAGSSSTPLRLLDKILMRSELKDEEVKSMWDMVKYMIQLPPISSSENIIRQRYSEIYTMALVSQAKKFLQDRFKIYMESIVKENPSPLPHIDVPDFYRLVHNFVGIRFKEEYLGLQDGMVDDRPLWPMVYYCLRSGNIPAAVYCLRDRHHNPEIKEIVTILEKKLDDPFSSENDILEENIRIGYQSVRNCTDPFKRIIWAVLGCYNEISEASKTADDYLWFKLSLVREECSNGGCIKYRDLQTTLLEEQGESHFDAFNKPYLYFKLLMLTGQFEAAIEFLFRTEKFKVHSVHMAIALNELNLLALPQDINTSLISVNAKDPTPARRLNFVLLIKNYIEKFESDCLNAALNYLFLLRCFTSSEGKNIFQVNVADLVVRTKQYVGILGKFQQSCMSGKRSRHFNRTCGLIHQFKLPDLFSNIVLEIKSQIMVKSENWEELLAFYSIVNDEDGMLNFMCTMLSKVAHLEGQEGSLRNKLQNRASGIAEQYFGVGYKGDQAIYLSFIKAKGLLNFFDQYREKRYSEALKILTSLKIVPLKLEDLNKTVYNIRALNEDLVKVIPNVLLATMNILANQCEKIKTSNPNQQHLRWVWEQANTITNFAEKLPTEIIGDTLNRLVEMEILLHT